MKRKQLFALGFSAFLAAAATSGLQAATYTWTGTAADAWTNTAKWSPNGTPGTGDAVQTNNGSVLNLTTGQTPSFSDLWVAHTTNGGLTLQTGSSVTSNNNITLGRQTGTGNNSGTITISGGSLIGQQNLYTALTTGDSTGLSTTNITQTAGASTISGLSFIGGGFINDKANDGWGKKGRGVSTYDISGGTFTSKNLYVGAVRGNGTLNISGTGAVTSRNDMYVGYAYSGTALGPNEGVGVINQTGGSLTLGAGALFNIGGDNTVPGSLGTGTYNISGGSVNANVILVGTRSGTGYMTISDTAQVTTVSNIVVSRHEATGTLKIEGGTTKIGENLIVGGAADSSTAPGTGTVLQTNGNVTATGSVCLGGFADGNTKGAGFYEMTGGSLTAGGARVGYKNGTGTLTVDGGTFTTPWLAVSEGAGTGTVNVGKTGTLKVNGNMAINNANGSVNVSGGTLNVTGALHSYAGTVDFSGGTVNVTGSLYSYAGTVDFSGGTVKITGNLDNNASGSSTVNISGGTVDLGGFFYLRNRETTISGGSVKLGRIQKTDGGAGVLNIIGGEATIDVGRFAINYAHAELTTFNFGISSTGISTLNGLGAEPTNGGDVTCGTFSASTAGGVAIMNNSLYSLLYSPKLRTDDAGQAADFMYLDNTGDWELTRTFTVNGTKVTDHGTVAGSPSYLNVNVTDLTINAKLKDSAKLGVITVGEGNNGVDFDFAEGKDLDNTGWFELGGEGKYILELNFQNAGNIDDLVSWMNDQNQGALDIAAVDADSIVIKNLEAIAGQPQYLGLDFSGYLANPNIALADFSGRQVPEPSTWALLLVGLLGLTYIRRRK